MARLAALWGCFWLGLGPGCGDDAGTTDVGDGAVEVAPDTSAPDTTSDSNAPGDAVDTDEGDAADTGEGPDVADAPDADVAEEVADAADGEVADDVAPPAEPSIFLTIAEIPESMNGSVPSLDPPVTWRLRANRAHVTLDVMARAGSGPIDDVTLGCEADDEPHPLGPVEARAAGHWRVIVDAASAFPDGARVVCTASATGPGGTASASYDFDAATLTPALDPFPAVDEWLVVLSRDIFALSVTDTGQGTASLRSDFVQAGNGVVDFDEPFLEMGLLSATNADARAVVKQHLLERIRRNVYQFYGLDAQGAPTTEGVQLRLWFEGDAGAPDAAAYGGERRFSMIALGGDGKLVDQQGGLFGRAKIDWNNQETEDDTVYGLGVFPTGLARQVLALPLGGFLLADYRPSQGGVAFGDDPDDHWFIGQDLEASDLPEDSGAAAARIEVYNLLVEFGALALSSILAHEMGHSLGLVPFGLPPEGLFAGVDVDFTVSLAPDAHIDTPGLNIMQTGGSVNWVEAVGGDMPRFEPLSWAYLTRQLVVGPQPD